MHQHLCILHILCAHQPFGWGQPLLHTHTTFTRREAFVSREDPASIVCYSVVYYMIVYYIIADYSIV